MSSDGGPTVAVKLFIDKEKKRVLFAESDKEFVDVLFSFLTLPLGTIVRRLGKQSQMGCLDELYKSVESFGLDHFQSTACRAMLLSPINAALFYCDRIQVKVDDTNQSGFYICSQKQCTQFSSVYGICNCKPGRWPGHLKCPSNLLVTVGDSEDGVFVKSGPKFIVTDDLQVAPASTSLVFSLLDGFGLQDQAKLEEKILELNANKITSLLKVALMSKQPLTGLCFDIAISPVAMQFDKVPDSPFPKDDSTKPVFSAIKIKLVHTKDNSSVLYAEVGADFVDILFGLLCVPLGSVIKAYGQWSSDGSIDTLYRSIDGSARTCMKHGSPSLLLTPKLAPFFGCSRNVLRTEEMIPRSVYFSCFKCRVVGGANRCGCTCPNFKTVAETNPKSPSTGSDNNAKAYVKGGLRTFLVTNDLRVLHFTLTNTLQVMRSAKIPKEKLVEKELTLDKTQALKLLRAAMLTRDAHTSLLLPPKK